MYESASALDFFSCCHVGTFACPSSTHVSVYLSSNNVLVPPGFVRVPLVQRQGVSLQSPSRTRKACDGWIRFRGGGNGGLTEAGHRHLSLVDPFFSFFFFLFFQVAPPSAVGSNRRYSSSYLERAVASCLFRYRRCVLVLACSGRSGQGAFVS